MNKNKTLNTILIIAIVVGVVGLLFWIGRANVGSSRNPASLTAVNSNLFREESFYDFGIISMAAGVVRHDFTVTNNGSEPLRIERMYTSCMCTIAEFIQNGAAAGPFGMPGHGPVPLLRKTVAPGETVTIGVTFDPAAHGPAGIGPVEREIYLEGQNGPLLTLVIKANVTP